MLDWSHRPLEHHAPDQSLHEVDLICFKRATGLVSNEFQFGSARCTKDDAPTVHDKIDGKDFDIVGALQTDPADRHLSKQRPTR